MRGAVTRILNDIEQGDAQASEELLPVVYEELRRLAAQKLSQELPGQTLQPTALVHEAYMRLVGTESTNWDDQGHFFAAAAEAMRRILIDNARRKKSLKHGGDRQKVGLEHAEPIFEGPSEDLLLLDEALQALMKKDPVKGELVKLRYFGGLSMEQAGGILGISTASAYRYWDYARSWLFLEMEK